MNTKAGLRKALKSRERQADRLRKLPLNMLYTHQLSNGDPLEAYRAYDLFRKQGWRTIRYDPSGAVGQCFNNVNKRIAESGGSLVNGWGLALDAIGDMYGLENRFRNCYIFAHSVWMSDGRLIDVTDHVGLPTFFCPDPDLGKKHPRGRSICFLDNNSPPVGMLQAYLTGYHRWLVPIDRAKEVVDLGWFEPDADCLLPSLSWALDSDQ